MDRNHIFNKETDSEKVAMDIVRFLRKWGMWKDVQIFTGGKCYNDDEKGELQIRDEDHPEKYLKAMREEDCNGNMDWKDFSNPEMLLDLTFEGPLYLLLCHGEYEVRIGEVSEEVKHILIPETNECQDEVEERMDAYFDGKYGWDPAEYDSYEEWLEINRYCDMDEFSEESENIYSSRIEFSSREEYEDFILRSATVREAKLREHFEEEICDSADYSNEVFYDNGKIANQIITEFNELLKKYGLWYELGFSWSLTTYRI